MNTNPLEITRQRQNGRKQMHLEERRIVALELVADTLEAIRRDLSDVLARLPQKLN